MNFVKFVRTSLFTEHHLTTASDYNSISSSENGELAIESEGRIGKRNFKL